MRRPVTRVALITQFFPPETFAGANRVAAIADALVDVGTLAVIAPEPSYPDADAYRDYQPPTGASRVELHRIPPFTGQRRSWAVRAAAEAWMAARLAAVAARRHADVLVASSPSMFLGPASLVAARASSARFVWDLRDLTWEYGKEEGVIDGVAARTSLGALARVMWGSARLADVVVCATEGLVAAVEARLPRQRVELVRNGVDAALLKTFDPSPPPPGRRLSILYAGLIGHAQELEVLLDVAERSPENDVVIAGDGPRRAELEQAARSRGLANVRFAGYVDPSELVRLYHASDLLFAQLRSSELHSLTAAPSKLLEYMAAGRPIVYGGEGHAAALVAEVGCGVVTPPGDAAAIVAAIEQIGPEMRASYGQRGRAYVEALPSRADEMRRFASIVGGLA